MLFPTAIKHEKVEEEEEEEGITHFWDSNIRRKTDQVWPYAFVLPLKVRLYLQLKVQCAEFSDI